MFFEDVYEFEIFYSKTIIFFNIFISHNILKDIINILILIYNQFFYIFDIRLFFIKFYFFY